MGGGHLVDDALNLGNGGVGLSRCDSCLRRGLARKAGDDRAAVAALAQIGADLLGCEILQHLVDDAGQRLVDQLAALAVEDANGADGLVDLLDGVL